MKTTTIAIVLVVVLAATVIWFRQPKPEPPAPLSLSGPCIGDATGNHCAPFVGCIAGSGITFEGRANGFLGGEIVGTLSNGAACYGDWKVTSPRSGKALTECEDGTSFHGRYLGKNAEEGYVVGKGVTKSGQTVFAVSSSLAYRTGRVTPASIPRLHQICRSWLGGG